MRLVDCLRAETGILLWPINEVVQNRAIDQILDRDEKISGVANAMCAVEDLGFEAVYATGAGIANMEIGVPAIGLTTMAEVADIVVRRYCRDSIDIERWLLKWGRNNSTFT